MKYHGRYGYWAPLTGVWCLVVIELEYHLELDVTSDCPSDGAMTVTMLTELSDIRLALYPWCLVFSCHRIRISSGTATTCRYDLDCPSDGAMI